MDLASEKGAVVRNGANPTEANRCATPSEQAEMLADARASVSGFLTNLIGRRLPEVAYALYPHLGPLQAEKHLARNLRGDQKRKLGVHEIDAVLTVLGREDEEKWLRFTMRRRGIRPPDVFERPGEIDELRAENARLRAESAKKDETIKTMAETFAAASKPTVEDRVRQAVERDVRDGRKKAVAR